MVSPVTTIFDGTDTPSKVVKKIIRGIVRHFKKPRSTHYAPYTGVLIDPSDLSEHKIDRLSHILNDFPDGEEIEIVVTSKGKSEEAKGFVWMLTEPHIYGRVPEEEWRKTLPKEAVT